MTYITPSLVSLHHFLSSNSTNPRYQSHEGTVIHLLMLAATDAMACRPDAHCLLTAYTGTVSGSPASNMPMRLIVAPAPARG